MTSKRLPTVFLCIAAAALLLVFLSVLQIHQGPENPYDAILAGMTTENVDSIVLLKGHPVKEIPVTGNDLSRITELLSQVHLGTYVPPDWDEMVGGPTYYDLRIRLTDGTDFILSVSDLYFAVWPDSEAYYYPSIPKDREGPSGYPIDVGKDEACREILAIAETLYYGSEE